MYTHIYIYIYIHIYIYIYIYVDQLYRYNLVALTKYSYVNGEY